MTARLYHNYLTFTEKWFRISPYPDENDKATYIYCKWFRKLAESVCAFLCQEIIKLVSKSRQKKNEPSHEIMVIITQATSEGSGETAV